MVSRDQDGRPDILLLRHHLFGDNGYCVIRGFCSLDDTREIRRFWHRHPMPPGRKGYWKGREDYAQMVLTTDVSSTDEGSPFQRFLGALGKRFKREHVSIEGSGKQGYECFFWNPPRHPLTYEIAWSCLLLRNALWELPLYTHVLPLDGYACSYRPTRTDSGDPGVHKHSDQRSSEKYSIQISLQLSEPGADYEGGGLILRTPMGAKINIQNHEGIGTGDLVLFNQVLEHRVDKVTHSNPEDPFSGYWRLLMPFHPVVEKPSEWVSGMVTHPKDRDLARHSSDRG